MLVLSRKIGDRVVIGTGAARITLTVVDIRFGTLRLGIEAPKDVLILREELTVRPGPPAASAEASDAP
jgi:carbon storage regulator